MDLALQAIIRDATSLLNRTSTTSKYDNVDLETLSSLRAHKLDLVYEALCRGPNALAKSEFCLRQERRDEIFLNEATQICAAMEKKEIKACLVKGIHSAIALYGSFGLRKYADIDLLIEKSELSRAKKVLQALGYKQGAYKKDEEELRFIEAPRSEVLRREIYTHETEPFRKVDQSGETVEIDINFIPYWLGSENQSQRHLAAAGVLLRGSHRVSCPGGFITCLNAEAALVHAACHLHSEATLFLQHDQETKAGAEIALYRLVDAALLASKVVDWRAVRALSIEIDRLHSLEYTMVLLRELFPSSSRIVPVVFQKDFSAYDYFYSKDGRRIFWRTAIRDRLDPIFDRASEILVLSSELR